MENWEIEFEKQSRLRAQWAVESKNGVYTPEIQFNKQQWVCGEPQTDYNNAVKIAQAFQEMVYQKQIQAGMSCMSGLKKAKP